MKCPRCGLVGWSGAEVCKRCGAPLGGGDSEPREPESPRAGSEDFTLVRDVPTGSRTWKLVLIVVLAVALCGGGWILYRRRAESRRGSGEAEAAMRKGFAGPSLDERARDAVLAYLAQPGFAGMKLGEQVLGPVRLELLQLTDREVYFSAPSADGAGQLPEQFVGRFVVDPKRVVLAEEDGGRLRLGKYSLAQTAEGRCFFKTPVDNVRFDPAAVLQFPFAGVTYAPDVRELSDFLQNKSIFGGRMRARTGQSRAGLPVVFANHGAFVARPGEASLRRFVGELTSDLPADVEGAREARVQRVLDFVSREIAYDLSEATSNFELLKRPNEVLMTGQSDCSNKAILLGSLLEQLGEDYLFVYTPDHITVAVRQGRFPARNGLSLEWEGETWLVAEGTVPGFRIGLDRVRDEARLKQFRHVQRPKDKDVIFDIATGRQLLFQ